MTPFECVLHVLRSKAKRFSLRDERFYSLSYLINVNANKEELQQCNADKLNRELRAMSDIFDVENTDTWTTFLDVYVNAHYDPIEEKDYKATILHLRRLVQLSEAMARERWVYEFKTRSGHRIYAKVLRDKLVVWGDTYPVKDTLKRLGLRWDPVEKVWYAPNNAINVINVNALREKLEKL